MNLDRVDYIVADPDDKDCVVYFNDDNNLYLDEAQTSKLLKVVDEFSAVNKKEIIAINNVPPLDKTPEPIN